ncbi:hypothetical protein FB451DRAFT_1171471 [Mycena latifolia]|nr:hypothetical protein FB451DRAFT_1171471 [Mycena latifolia]
MTGFPERDVMRGWSETRVFVQNEGIISICLEQASTLSRAGYPARMEDVEDEVQRRATRHRAVPDRYRPSVEYGWRERVAASSEDERGLGKLQRDAAQKEHARDKSSAEALALTSSPGLRIRKQACRVKDMNGACAGRALQRWERAPVLRVLIDKQLLTFSLPGLRNYCGKEGLRARPHSCATCRGVCLSNAVRGAWSSARTVLELKARAGKGNPPSICPRLIVLIAVWTSPLQCDISLHSRADTSGVSALHVRAYEVTLHILCRERGARSLRGVIDAGTVTPVSTPGVS